ncbi:BrnT family toxin [Candidatus Tokpelaia sp.]|uniref:BrnT family toxin n=1 Tax=Candidatus Tokpelaia sp. TaxID=2233777 RepID=UPI00123BB5FF|nr:BrnT family toxin [Candidatus Tokpelaia sp.]KAA6405065.1 hypothetical protein DPQ22_05740 [Candidatus Tokpelaia sp.]
MRIVWDEPKRLANKAKHGLDFADIWDFGWENALIAPTYNNRFKAIGSFRGKGAVVIYANMGKEAVSIIGFRPAGKAERKKYL